MLLAIERKVDGGFFSKRFVLTLKAEAAPEELHLIRKHEFGDWEIYVSPEVEAEREKMFGALDRGGELRWWHVSWGGDWDSGQAAQKWEAYRSAMGSMWKVVRGSTVNLGDCLSGVRLNAGDLSEAVMAEGQIRERFALANGMVAVLGSYDESETVLLEPEIEDAGIGPSDWSLQPLGRTR